MPRRKNPDLLADLIKGFALLSAAGDANGWLSARAVWGPELRGYLTAHAPKRMAVVEDLLARPIPPPFPPELPPTGVNLQQHLGRHRLDRDAAARDVTAAILAILQEVQKEVQKAAQKAATAKPAKRK